MHTHTHTLLFTVCVLCVESQQVPSIWMTDILYSTALYCTSLWQCCTVLYNTVPVEWVEVTGYEEEPATEFWIDLWRNFDSITLYFFYSFAFFFSENCFFLKKFPPVELLHVCMTVFFFSALSDSGVLICQVHLHENERELCQWGARWHLLWAPAQLSTAQHSTTSTLHWRAWSDYFDECRGMLST